MGSNTFQTLLNNIASDLTRSDLSSQSISAVQDAINFYEADRFWFNQTRSQTFQTVPGQQIYTTTDFSYLPNVIEFDTIFFNDAVTQWQLNKLEDDEFQWLQFYNTSPGRSTDFTYSDGTLMFWPIPLTAYTVRPIMHFRFPMLTNPADSTPWCNEAERLIRAHAKMILFANVMEDDAGAQRMQQQIPALKAKLDEETTSRLATGMIRAPRGHF